MSSQNSHHRQSSHRSSDRDRRSDHHASSSSSQPNRHGPSDDARNKDREQRDKLDEHLRRKETHQTKQLAARTDSRHINDIAKKLKLDPNVNQDKVIDEIRKKSRTTYLSSRAAKQLTIYEEDFKDEKNLFSGEYLTEKKRQQLEYQEKIIGITKSTIDAAEKAKKVKQYLMPDSREIDYVDPEEDDNDTNAEQRKWEQAKFEDANLKLASSNANAPPKDFLDVSDIELLLQDTEFIERVKRGDTFEEEKLDIKKREKEAREREKQQLREQRKNLPVYEHKAALLQAIAENQIIIVQGETGCGKTTQIPQYLHEAGYTKTEMKDGETKIVGCTQPRRVAAMSVAARVSQEVNTKYQIRL